MNVKWGVPCDVTLANSIGCGKGEKKGREKERGREVKVGKERDRAGEGSRSGGGVEGR